VNDAFSCFSFTEYALTFASTLTTVFGTVLGFVISYRSTFAPWIVHSRLIVASFNLRDVHQD
jgi:hypothetical protein